MIWFTSDWHLGHKGIFIHQPNRNEAFFHIEDMNDHFIDTCNRVVKPKDTLYFLGDFCWRASKAVHYRCRLKVKIMNVCRGNHDKASLGKQVTTFEHMIFAKFKIDDEIKKFHLCHYPLLSWDSKDHGGYHLHGHCHGNLDFYSSNRIMDVGIDNVHRLLGEWRPIGLHEILATLG